MEKSLTGEDHAVLSHPHDHPQELVFEGDVLSSRTLLLGQKRQTDGQRSRQLHTFRHECNYSIQFYSILWYSAENSQLNQLHGSVKLTGLRLVIKLGP